MADEGHKALSKFAWTSKLSRSLATKQGFVGFQFSNVRTLKMNDGLLVLRLNAGDHSRQA